MVDFDVEMNQFPDNATHAVTAAAIETWLDALSVTTVHKLYIDHIHGFYVCIVIYV